MHLIGSLPNTLSKLEVNYKMDINNHSEYARKHLSESPRSLDKLVIQR
jgi:hypothetical protein